MPRKGYKRVLLKLSGEVFGGEKGIGVDPDVVHDIANQIARRGTYGSATWPIVIAVCTLVSIPSFSKKS